jgi:hypothetical protein
MNINWTNVEKLQSLEARDIVTGPCRDSDLWYLRAHLGIRSRASSQQPAEPRKESEEKTDGRPKQRSRRQGWYAWSMPDYFEQ